MKKVFILLILPILLFCCEKEIEENTPSFIEGKFVSTQYGNVCIWDVNWTNPKQITSDALWKPLADVGYYDPGYTNPLWSSDGSQIICIKSIRNNGDFIWIMDNKGENKKKIFQLNEQILAMDWSNDGEWIAYSTISDGSIHIISLDGQEHKILNEHDEHQIRYISWSDDSRKIAFCNNANNLFILDVETKELINQHDCSGITRKPCWSPNGEFIAFGRKLHPEGQIIIINVIDKTKEIIKEGQGFFRVFRWTPDGEYIIYLVVTLDALQISTGAIIDLGYKDKNNADHPTGDLFIIP